MKIEIIAAATAITVGGGLGWWLAGVRAPASVAVASATPAASPSSPTVDAAAASTDVEAAREAARDEVLTAGVVFERNPCLPAARERWEAANRALGVLVPADDRSSQTWRTQKDRRIGAQWARLVQKGVVASGDYVTQDLPTEYADNPQAQDFMRRVRAQEAERNAVPSSACAATRAARG